MAIGSGLLSPNSYASFFIILMCMTSLINGKSLDSKSSNLPLFTKVLHEPSGAGSNFEKSYDLRNTDNNNGEGYYSLFPYIGNVEFAFTSLPGNEGTSCNLSSLIFPSYELRLNLAKIDVHRFGNLKLNHKKVYAILKNAFGHVPYTKFKELWICMKFNQPGSNSLKSFKDGKLRKPSHFSNVWIHQGSPSVTYSQTNSTKINFLHGNFGNSSKVRFARSAKSSLPINLRLNNENSDDDVRLIVKKKTGSHHIDSKYSELNNEKMKDSIYIPDTVLRTKEIIILSDSGNDGSNYRFVSGKPNIKDKQVINVTNMLSDDPNVIVSDNLSDKKSLHKRDLSSTDVPFTHSPITNTIEGPVAPHAYGLRLISDEVIYDDNSISVKANAMKKFQIFGEGFTKNTEIQFTAKEDAFGNRCDVHTSEVFKIDSHGTGFAIVNVIIPVMSGDQKKWFLCVKPDENAIALHQGPGSGLTVVTYTRAIPLWIQVVIVVV